MRRSELLEEERIVCEFRLTPLAVLCQDGRQILVGGHSCTRTVLREAIDFLGSRVGTVGV